MARAEAIVRGGARERILDTAYELFSVEGIRGVGIDRLTAESGVAKTTLYHHFPSKDDLAVAFLGLRHERWTEVMFRYARGRSAEPRGQLLAVFEFLDGWFRGEEYECCSFVRALLEHYATPGVVRDEAVRRLEDICRGLETLAREAGLADPHEVAADLEALMWGAVLRAAIGDREAAPRAQAMARERLSRDDPS